MRALTDRALEVATQLGSGYADVRIVRRRDESIGIKSGRLEGVASSESEGFGVRVLVDGAWGFASSNHLELSEADRVAALAVRIAKASATALRRPRRARRSAPGARSVRDAGRWRIPSTSRWSGRSAHLMEADRAARCRPRASRSPSRSTVRNARKRRSRPRTAASPSRSSPTSGPRSKRTPSTATSTSGAAIPTPGVAGWPPATSTSGSLDLVENAERHAEEAVELLTAPQCPPGSTTIVLDPTQLYMQVHESCGHPTELDRVFGTEASLRRHELPDHGQARRRFSLRIGPDHDRRRRHGPGRHGHVRLGRRGRGRPVRAARPERDPGRLPELPRDGAAHRPASRAARCAPTAGTASRSSG